MSVFVSSQVRAHRQPAMGSPARTSHAHDMRIGGMLVRILWWRLVSK